jgi:hypothetical protein
LVHFVDVLGDHQRIVLVPFVHDVVFRRRQ